MSPLPNTQSKRNQSHEWLDIYENITTDGTSLGTGHRG